MCLSLAFLLIPGGWWEVKKMDDMVGNVALEIGEGTYVSALDNGLLTMGPPRADGNNL